MKQTNAVSIVILVILFTWLGYAYYKGPTPLENTLLLHPLVALMMIVLIQSAWGTSENHTVWTVGSILLGLWLFLRLLDTLMPFVIGFAVAYLFYLLADFFNALASRMARAPLFQPPSVSPEGRWFQRWFVRLKLLVPGTLRREGLPFSPTMQRILGALERVRFVRHAENHFFLSHWLTRVILIALGVGIVLFFALHVGPQMGEQSGLMQEGLKKFYDKASEYLVAELKNVQEGTFVIPGWIPIPSFLETPAQEALAEAAQYAEQYVTERIPDIAKRGSEFATSVLNGLSKVLSGAIGTAATGVLAIMVFAYAIGGFRQYMRRFVGLFPLRHQDSMRQYLVEIDTNMKLFLRGQLLVITLVGLLSMIVYGVIGVPFAILVGLLAGICNAIPTFGPYIGGLIAVLALLMGWVSGNYTSAIFLGKLVMTFAGMFGVQMVDNSLISPRVMSSAVDVDPLLIMFSVIVGAALIGFWGVLLAIPAIVVIKSVIQVSRHLRAERLQEQQ